MPKSWSDALNIWGYNLIDTIKNHPLKSDKQVLERREGIDHESSCFDYIELIYKYDGDWVVGVFVEPVAWMEVKAKTLQKALTFWLELFQNQPKDWDYRKAGWHLLDRIVSPIFDVNNVNSKDIWNDS